MRYSYYSCYFNNNSELIFFPFAIVQTISLFSAIVCVTVSSYHYIFLLFFLISLDSFLISFQVQPTCNDLSGANEIVLIFTIPKEYEHVGIEVRTGPHSVNGTYHDTALELRKDHCTWANATVTCNDDSTPPGDYLSLINALLSPGTYYLYVDGYDFTEAGPVGLDIKFVNNCRPICDGSFCGTGN